MCTLNVSHRSDSFLSSAVTELLEFNDTVSTLIPWMKNKSLKWLDSLKSYYKNATELDHPSTPPSDKGTTECNFFVFAQMQPYDSGFSQQEYRMMEQGNVIHTS